jgi:D-xylose reductase
MIEDPVPLLETWQAMEELVNEGLVRNIGVCNFGTALLRDLINSHTAVKPAVLQVEIHPYLNQKRLIKYGRQNGVPVTSYSTLGGTSYV